MHQSLLRLSFLAFAMNLMILPSVHAQVICPAPPADTTQNIPQPLPDPSAETPASLACIYNLTSTHVPGCPIATTSATPTGGWGAIAVIEGGDDPNAYAELTAFSQYYHLPVLPLCNGSNAPCFATFQTPGQTINRAPDVGEHVIDIEWAHAMAPNASIYMVEAARLCIPDALVANQYASTLVAAAGGGIISNSWSVDEFPTETSYDHYFQTPGIVYIASSGDYAAPARYPSSSPYVISAGGTSILRDRKGNFTAESVWRDRTYPIGQKLSGSSGGPSRFESRPFFQNSVAKIVGTQRGTPDISFAADPRTGMSIYKTYCTDVVNQTGCTSGWLKSGGTSLAAPALAGIINSANSRASTTTEELAIIYNGALKNYRSYWNDVVLGNNGFPSLPGYDFATGLGTAKGYRGK